MDQETQHGGIVSCSKTRFTIIIEQHVFRFKISVDDASLVKMLQPLDDLSNVERGSGFVKPWVVLIHQVDVIP